MKRIPAFLTLCLCGALCAFAQNAPQKDKGGNWVFPPFYFSGQGQWDTKRCWREGKTPDTATLPRINVLGGATMTISQPIPYPASWMCLGFYNDKKTTIHFEKNAQLSLAAVMMPTPYVDKSNADFYMTGGTLSVGELKEKEFNAALSVGAGGTTSGTALFAISGGKLTGSLRVGTSRPNTNTGTFSLRGSQASVSGPTDPKGILMVWASGTLEFVLDEKGVSTMNYGKNILTLHEGANIVIDGTAYKGGAQQLWLVKAARVVKVADVNLSTRGFAPGYKAEVSLDPKGVVLKISKEK